MVDCNNLVLLNSILYNNTWYNINPIKVSAKQGNRSEKDRRKRIQTYICTVYFIILSVRHPVLFEVTLFLLSYEIQPQVEEENTWKGLPVLRIQGSHNGGYEEFFLLGYDAMQSVECHSVFCRNTLQPSSGSKKQVKQATM